MFRFSARWLAAPAVVAVAAAVIFLNPNRGSATDAEGTELVYSPEYRAMDAQQAVVTRRIEVKNELVTQLIAGRVTLEFVTAEFLRLNSESPLALGVLRDQYAGASDEEKSARNVIEYTRLRFSASSDEGEAVVARLRAEFDARFGAAP